MKNKNLLLKLILLLSLMLPLFAESISIGTRTAPDYRSDSFSYNHTFNEEYSGSLYYGYDGLEKSFNSFQLGLDKNFDENSYAGISLGTDDSVDYSKTKSIGFTYGITFKDNIQEVLEEALVVSGDATSQNIYNETVATEIQFLIPRLSLGVNFSDTTLLSENYTDTARNIVFGVGAKIGQYVDVALSGSSYSYSSEKTLRTKGVSRIAGNPLLQQLTSSPRTAVDSTITLTPWDFLQLYYSTNSTKDLLGEVAESKTVGLNISLLDNWSVDISKEETSDQTVYSALSVGYYF